VVGAIPLLDDRRPHDIAVDPAGVEPADVVVLHRVVCCYPDYRRLLAAAGEHARRLLVFSYPRYNAGTRLVLAAQNLLFLLLRKRFRVFAHPPAKMLSVLREAGLQQAFTHRRLAWRVAGLER